MAIQYKNFLLLELVMAMALLMILSTAFFASLNTLKRLDLEVSNDRAGLLAVDNTLERLAPLSGYDDALIDRIFHDEFARSGLERYNLLRPEVRRYSDHAVIALRRPHGAALIEVTIKCRR